MYVYVIQQVLKAADIVLMTIIRCLAILFTYYHFRNLQRMGSKYILGKDKNILYLYKILPIIFMSIKLLLNYSIKLIIKLNYY